MFALFFFLLFNHHAHCFSIRPESAMHVIETVYEWFPLLWHFSSQSTTDAHSAMSRGRLADEEMEMSIEEIVERSGFRIERHEVTTEDGYILAVYRVRHQETKDGAPAVLMQHGIIDSSDGWVMNHEEKAPAFVLAKRGYDVWLGNQRGTMHSRRHVSLDPDSWDPEERRKFFDYSFQEMGDYDVPALVKLVRTATGLQNITYMGHS